jgi:hypothetical protein
LDKGDQQMMKKLVHNKLIMGFIGFYIFALSFLPPLATATASTVDSSGFVIQADQVVGKDMTASIVFTETSGNDKVPMLRIHYREAEIYGMKLTKQLNTPQGPVSITLKAAGPVRMNGMTVDTSAISVKGACLRATETIPQAGLKDVTMLVHYMNAEGSNIDQLMLQTLEGNQGPPKPQKAQILADLALLPYTQAVKEIEQISAGKKPLICDSPQEGTAKDNPVTPDVTGGILDGKTQQGALLPGVPQENLPGKEVGKVIDGTVDQIKEPISNVIQPVTGITDPLTKPVEDAVGKTVKPINEKVVKPIKEKVIKPVNERVIKPVDEKVIKPVKKKIEPVTKPVEETVAASCKRLNDSKGVITKQLGLDLIDQALKEDKALTALCSGKASETKMLADLEDGLTDKLGLGFLFKTPGNDEQRLKKMKERLQKENNNFTFHF